jgi:Flp pilus assembly pilin Flp
VVRIVGLTRTVIKLLRCDSAATATEYAVMLALILVVILASVTLFGQTLGAEYGTIHTTLFS